MSTSNAEDTRQIMPHDDGALPMTVELSEGASPNRGSLSAAGASGTEHHKKSSDKRSAIVTQPGLQVQVPLSTRMPFGPQITESCSMGSVNIISNPVEKGRKKFCVQDHQSRGRMVPKSQFQARCRQVDESPRHLVECSGC